MFKEYHEKQDYTREILKLHCLLCVGGDNTYANYDNKDAPSPTNPPPTGAPNGRS